ncbi:MAG: tetratricopeptide repeat protein [Bacteroidales bacterium]|nr:tetratricopeptide repeat protein [Bacteroidales bacterium]
MPKFLFGFALILFSLSETFCQEPDSVLVASYLAAGDSCKNNEKYDCAINNYLKATSGFAELGLNSLSAQVYHRMGKVYRLMGKYDKAIESDLRSLKINELLDDTEFIALNLNNVGIDFHRMLNYDKALEYLHQSLELREKIQDSVGIADCFINIGMVHDESYEFELALEYYEKALEFFEKISDQDGLAVCYNNIAGIYYFKGDLDKVLEYALLSLDIRREMNNKRDLSFNLIHIGMVYSAQEKFEDAILFIEEGLEMAKEVGARPQIKLGYEGLANVYSSIGDHKQAYDYLMFFININDSIFKEKSARAIAEMQTKYETEKKEQENEILKRDVKIQSNFKKNLLILAAFLIVLLISLFSLFRLKSTSLKQNKKLLVQEKEINKLETGRNKAEKKLLEDRIFAEKQLNRLQKEKYEAELMHKNQELANSALCIVNKNEVLSEIKEIVRSNFFRTEENNNFSELIRLINNNIDIDQNWKIFKLKFDDVHPGFFERLKEKYPNLSDVYIKLCAYIRIDLTSNEIARLINVTIAAVKKSRQRLRKKFDLDPEASLPEFIQNI